MTAAVSTSDTTAAAWTWWAAPLLEAAPPVSAEAVAGLLAAALAVWLWRNRAQVPSGAALPEGGWTPFFGHLFTLLRTYEVMYDEMLRRALQTGARRTWATAIPFSPCYLNLVDPACVEHFMRSPNYEKGPALAEIFGEVAGGGIFNVDGDEWRRQRKTASTMFSHRILRQDMFPVFLEHAHVLADVLGRAADEGRAVDAQDYFFRYTMDSIGLIAFGDRLDTLRASDGGVRFSRAFDAAQAVVKSRYASPLWRWARLLRLGEEGRMPGYVREIDEQAVRIVQHRRLVPCEDLRRHPDLLSRFIERRREEGVDFTDREARDVCVNFILAGRDTTGTLLTWTLYELARHPAVLDRVLAELSEAGISGGADPAFAAVSSLQYLEAVLYEVLRLHPSVPVDGKYAVADDVLPDGTRVPRGTMVAFSPYVMGRLPSLWERPDQFEPERFLGAKPSPFVFPAFNAGPRICLGKHVALLEAKTVFAFLLPRFRLELASPEREVRYAISIVLPARGGLAVRPRRRGAAAQ